MIYNRRMRKKAGRLLHLKSFRLGIVISLLRPVYELIDFLGNVDFIRQYWGQIGRFLESRYGTLLSILCGGAMVVWAVLNSREGSGALAQESTPSPSVPDVTKTESKRTINLIRLSVRLAKIDFHDNVLVEKTGGACALLAAFRNSPPTDYLDDVIAHVDYHFQDGKEIQRVNYGTWLDERFNTVTFDRGDTKELVLVMWGKGTDPQLVALEDHHHSVEEWREAKPKELGGPNIFTAKVTLITKNRSFEYDYVIKRQGDTWTTS